MQPDGDAGEVLAALADGTRRTILRQLATGEGATATELAAELPVTRQAVSKHLRVLEDAGLVAAHRAGRESRYELRPEALAPASRWIEELGAVWDERLARLKRAAESRR